MLVEARHRYYGKLSELLQESVFRIVRRRIPVGATSSSSRFFFGCRPQQIRLTAKFRSVHKSRGFKDT